MSSSRVLALAQADGKLCRHHWDDRAADLDPVRQLYAGGISQLDVDETLPAHLRALFADNRHLCRPRDYLVAHGEGSQWAARRSCGRVFRDAGCAMRPEHPAVEAIAGDGRKKKDW